MTHDDVTHDGGTHDGGTHDGGTDDGGTDDAAVTTAAHSGGPTRERIRLVALHLFAQRGYEHTSLNTIAERLQITKPALYYHFASKEALLEAAIEPLFADMESLLASHDLQRPQVRGFVERWADVLLEHRTEVRCLTQDTGAILRTAIGRRAGQLGELLRAALAGADPTLSGRVRTAAAIGALQGALTSFPDVPSEALRGPALDAAMAALAPPANDRCETAAGQGGEGIS
ncbi:MAG: TetR/AcrR family transcriptional regulator [Mycobacteriales bacterium]|nr:MAG: TetR family transcriptional regulator [Pseudonocardiales bacterium]